MGCEVNGVSRNGFEKVNEFALVIYIPDRLARFLDGLRLELIAECRPHAHVTVLPPRPLADEAAAMEQVRTMTPEFAPFEIEVGDVEIFPQTNVIYMGVASGSEELRAMHKAMNTGALAYAEQHAYHPHLTLAQEFPAAETPRLAALARKRWSEYRGPRSFRAERVAFVQNTAAKRWLDLAEFALGAVLQSG